MGYKAVIFDMDGTILNTLDDMRVAVNYAMGECGHRADWGNDMVRIFFGSGVDVALRRALAAENGAAEADLLQIGDSTDGTEFRINLTDLERIKEIYMPYYAAHCNDLTGPYDGVIDTIAALRARGIKTAVVSNKPDIAVQTLAHDIFPGLFDVSIGELPDIARKPAPDMTVKALHALGVSAREAVYVGDTEIDILTAENADLPCISVAWGFRSRAYLLAHHADPIIDQADDLLPLVVS